jgi:D-sedoheptulose 7-phosphate isomerase
MQKNINKYINKFQYALQQFPMLDIQALGEALFEAWRDGRHVYFCGNGGSAANAIHLANDFIYGAGIKHGRGLKAEALCANASVLSCLANDLGYEHIYSKQIEAKGATNDVLVVLSGSGNSPNVIEAIKTANLVGMKTFAILGFSGGKCKELAQYPIHFDIDDMQIAEDMQLIVGHICMQWLSDKIPTTGVQTIQT